MGDNNGQKGFINEDIQFLNDGNTISFGQDTATMFYQGRPYFTGDKIKILKSKDKRFNKKIAEFYISTMNKAFSSFSWGGSSFNVNIIKQQTITLPAKDGKPDYIIIENFVDEIEKGKINRLDSYLKESNFYDYKLTKHEQEALDNYDKLNFEEFKMEDLFEKIKTKKLPYKADELSTNITGNFNLPCLTSSFKNQGLNYFAPKNEATILKNVISIPSNSDVYRAYFQSNEFTVLSDAYAINWTFEGRNLSKCQHLFAVQCINKVTDLPIYSYKNKLGGWNVVKNKHIKLPTKNGKPDYEAMETIISAIQKSVIKNVVLYTKEKLA